MRVLELVSFASRGKNIVQVKSLFSSHTQPTFHQAAFTLRLVALYSMVTLFGIAFPAAVNGQSLFKQEQQAIQQAVAAVNSSIVRIETVGGVDLVGDVLTGTGPTTGVIVSADGYIITSSFNFFSDPASVLVTLVNNESNKKFAAKIIASDNSKMLTLLKIEASGLKPITAAGKSEIKVGQRAIALGRTFDVSFPNISTGIISALNRVNGKAIQTDAKTSPVNYGGPLIDLYGRCLGIIVPLSPQQEGEASGVEWYDSGIGFAIPLEDIERVLNRMTSGETLHRGLLGVGFETQSPLAGEAKVLRVRLNSPADEAGLKINDVIVKIDEQTINRLVDLRQILGNRYAGETVKLVVKRANETFESEVKLTDELLAYEFNSLGILPQRPAIDESVQGVGIRYVFENSGAEKAGLKPGNQIKTISGQKVSTPKEIATVLSAMKNGQSIELTITRGDEELTLPVSLSAMPNGDGSTNVPPITIPSIEAPEDLKTGRFNQKLTGSDRNFWVFVPESYNASYEHGMLVWVHPSGDTMEADVLRFWKDFCVARGIILVGPRAEDLSGWSATDEKHVKDVTDWVTENYSISTSRIAIMGSEDSGVFATRLAFKNRELFRGLIAMESPLRIPPPDSDPDSRLLIAFIAAPETRGRERIEKSVELLRKQKFPTALLDSEEAGKFSFDLVNSLIQWLDSLDRL